MVAEADNAYVDNDWEQDKYRVEEDKYRVENDVENFPENGTHLSVFHWYCLC